MFDTPILFLIFNRPDTAKQVFERIREVKPKYLFIAADGPRSSKVGEGDLCIQTRNVVLENIDWECEVKTLIRDENLGCGIAVSQAITWFFDNVEAGIILEDDCLPDLSFFYFCQKMLNFYSNSTNVGIISGFNTFNSNTNDFYFHYLLSVWGWASWRRVWKDYEYNPNLENLKSLSLINNSIIELYYSEIYKSLIKNENTTWDVQLVLSLLKKEYLVISPTRSLISNIGIYGSHATGKVSRVQKIQSCHIDVNNLIFKDPIFDKLFSKLNISEVVKNIKSDNYEFFLVTLINKLKKRILDLLK